MLGNVVGLLVDLGHENRIPLGVEAVEGGGLRIQLIAQHHCEVAGFENPFRCLHSSASIIGHEVGAMDCRA